MRIHRCLLVVLTALFLLVNAAPAQAQGAGPDLPQLDNELFLPVLKSQVDARWHWEAGKTVELSPLPRLSNSILTQIDLQGRYHILWDTYDQRKFIYHTYTTDDGWSPISHVALTLGTSETLYPPYLDERGRMHFLWRNNLGSGQTSPYRLMYSMFDGNIWSPEELVYQPRSTTPGVQGMITSTGNGGVQATVLGESFLSSDIYVIPREGNAWATPTQIAPEMPVFLVWPDSFGGVNFYGYSNKDQLYYTYYHGGHYPIQNRIVDNHLTPGTSLLDGQNNLHVYSTGSVPIPGGTVTGLSHRCLYQNEHWGEKIVLSGEQSVNGVAAASDGVSRTLFAWREANSNLLWMTVFEGCGAISTSTISFPEFNNWSLLSVTLSNTPSRACALVRQAYSSTNFLVRCAQVDR